nr:MAG: polyprotein [Totiviridae sp.]
MQFAGFSRCELPLVFCPSSHLSAVGTGAFGRWGQYSTGCPYYSPGHYGGSEPTSYNQRVLQEQGNRNSVYESEQQYSPGYDEPYEFNGVCRSTISYQQLVKYIRGICRCGKLMQKYIGIGTDISGGIPVPTRVAITLAPSVLQQRWHPRQYAELLLQVCPPACPAEWRQRWCMYSFKFDDQNHTSQVNLPNPSTLLEFSAYKPAPPGLREIFQVHAVLVVQALPERWRTYQEVYARNKELVDYELGAIFMWWALLPDEIYEHMQFCGVNKLDFTKDGGKLGHYLEVVRQQGSACRCRFGPQLFLYLRKLGNLKGRVKGAIDVQTENFRSRILYPWRTMGDIGQPRTRSNYMYWFRKAAEQLSNKLVWNVAQTARKMTRSDWWARRVLLTSAGSSSLRHELDEYIANDDRITKNDRPNKKAVCEALEDDFVERGLFTLPQMVARRSIKHEPGRRHRPLYACDDLATSIAAYASHGIEKKMNFDGMCPQQRPQDVLMWWCAHRRRKSREVWLSTDYTDFNKEHSVAELALLNFYIAMAWKKLSESVGDIYYQKFQCAIWIAVAQCYRHFRSEEDSKYYRSYSGLWSGSRDTARDNTLLHRIYHSMVICWLDRNYPEWGYIKEIFMCGDDEDVVLSDPGAAAMYYLALKELGWHLNDKKQLCGYLAHEFLQKYPHPVKGVIAPYSSMISALCSGQWYKEPGMHQDMAINAFSDQFWELYVRGGNYKYVILMAFRVLNAYMRAKDPISGNSKDLEWWNFRNYLTKQVGYETKIGAKGYINPLWGFTTPGTRAPPTPFYMVHDCSKMPGKATAAWCRKQAHLFKRFGRENLMGEYSAILKSGSYCLLYHSYLQDQKKKYIWEHWPERETTIAVLLAAIPQLASQIEKAERLLVTKGSKIESILFTRSSSALPLTDGEVLAKAGSDLHLFNLLGGWDNLELVDFLQIRNPRHKKLPTWREYDGALCQAAWLMDPTLRSYILTTGPTS